MLKGIKTSNERIKTSVHFPLYDKWCADRDMGEKSQKEFVAAIRKKDLLYRHRSDGHSVRGYKLKEKAESEVVS
jgi:hypothetical protein